MGRHCSECKTFQFEITEDNHALVVMYQAELTKKMRTRPNLDRVMNIIMEEWEECKANQEKNGLPSSIH